MTAQLAIDFDVCASRHGGNPESAEAHESVKPSKTQLHRLILATLGNGMTCEEIDRQLGLKHQTASARISELRAQDAVTIIGRRATSSGRWASVYVARREM